MNDNVNLNQLQEEDIELINAYMYENMITFIDDYPYDISFINFENIFYENIFEMTKIFIESYFKFIFEYDDIDYELFFDKQWTIVCKIFYKNVIPRRSYKDTFIRNTPNKAKIEEKIKILRNIPQPEQRTDEWYKFRYNMITASNAYKCFENDASRNSIIYEKCKPFVEKLESTSVTNLNTAFHWGQKYEPLSVMIYESKFNTIIEDFGCIPHQQYDFLAASPDGINVDKNNNRYGRMLEIKNIVNRDIIDEPKKEYWIQMQLQMEVCNLNECDFLETRFKEYESYEEFKNDGSFTHTEQNMQKGIMILFIKDNNPIYEYAPLNISERNYNKWEKETMEKHENDMYVSVIYWYLDEFSCKLVLRNKKWFIDTIYAIHDTWNTIKKERIEGYEHRAPQKRVKKEQNIIQGCLINIDGSINNALENIDTLDNYVQENINDKLKQNSLKIHTESFDETHADVI
tara:strand:+ start:11178 stop:12557 length:1380 start_codon:yes stop_codon:yes gene_type:complete